MSNKTTYHNIEGRAKWAKVHESNTDEYGGVNFWILDLYLSPEELRKYKSIGLSNKIYEDEDGNPYIRPRRVKYKEFGRIPNKTYIEQLPPQIFDKDFNPINVYAKKENDAVDFNNKKSYVRYFDMNDKPEFEFGPKPETLIGNDSKVRINISSYPIQNGTARASQLESIVVLELVEFEKGTVTKDPEVKSGEVSRGEGASYEFPSSTNLDDEVPF